MLFDNTSTNGSFRVYKARISRGTDKACVGYVLRDKEKLVLVSQLTGEDGERQILLTVGGGWTDKVPAVLDTDRLDITLLEITEFQGQSFDDLNDLVKETKGFDKVYTYHNTVTGRYHAISQLPAPMPETRKVGEIWYKEAKDQPGKVKEVSRYGDSNLYLVTDTETGASVRVTQSDLGSYFAR